MSAAAGPSRPASAGLRGRALLLAALSIGLLSGVPAQRDSDPDTDRAEALAGAVHPEAHAWIAVRMAAINPALDPRTRERIAFAVDRFSTQFALDPELVTAVIEVESDARPWALSPKGAVGLMQVMPYMIEPLDFAGNPATIEGNIEAGCRILADNIRRLGEDKGISAYFWGNRIRGFAYLERVRQARAEIRRSNMS